MMDWEILRTASVSTPIKDVLQTQLIKCTSSPEQTAAQIQNLFNSCITGNDELVDLGFKISVMRQLLLHLPSQVTSRVIIKNEFIAWLSSVATEAANNAAIRGYAIGIIALIVKSVSYREADLGTCITCLTSNIQLIVDEIRTQPPKESKILPSDMILHQCVEVIKAVKNRHVTDCDINNLFSCVIDLVLQTCSPQGNKLHSQRHIDTMLLFSSVADLWCGINSNIEGNESSRDSLEKLVSLYAVPAAIIDGILVRDIVHDSFQNAFQSCMGALQRSTLLTNEVHGKSLWSLLLVKIVDAMSVSHVNCCLEIKRTETLVSLIGILFDVHIADIDAVNIQLAFAAPRAIQESKSENAISSGAACPAAATAIQAILSLQVRTRYTFANAKVSRASLKASSTTAPSSAGLQAGQKGQTAYKGKNLKPSANTVKSSSEELSRSTPVDTLQDLRVGFSELRTLMIEVMESILTAVPDWIRDICNREIFWDASVIQLSTPLLFAPAYRALKKSSNEEQQQHQQARLDAKSARESRAPTRWLVERVLTHLATGLKQASRYSIVAALDMLQATSDLCELGCRELIHADVEDGENIVNDDDAIVSSVVDSQVGGVSEEVADSMGHHSTGQGGGAGVNQQRRQHQQGLPMRISQPVRMDLFVALLQAYSQRPKGVSGSGGGGGSRDHGGEEAEHGVVEWKSRVADVLTGFIRMANSTGNESAESVEDAKLQVPSASAAYAATPAATPTPTAAGAGATAVATAEVAAVAQALQQQSPRPGQGTVVVPLLPLPAEWSARFLQVISGDVVCLYSALGVTVGPRGLGAVAPAAELKRSAEAVQLGFGAHVEGDQLTSLLHSLTALQQEFLRGKHFPELAAMTRQSSSTPPSLSSAESSSSPSSHPSAELAAIQSLLRALRLVQASCARSALDKARVQKELVFEDQLAQLCAEVELLTTAACSLWAARDRTDQTRRQSYQDQDIDKDREKDLAENHSVPDIKIQDCDRLVRQVAEASANPSGPVDSTTGAIPSSVNGGTSRREKLIEMRADAFIFSVVKTLCKLVTSITEVSPSTMDQGDAGKEASSASLAPGVQVMRRVVKSCVCDAFLNLGTVLLQHRSQYPQQTCRSEGVMAVTRTAADEVNAGQTLGVVTTIENLKCFVSALHSFEANCSSSSSSTAAVVHKLDCDKIDDAGCSSVAMEPGIDSSEYAHTAPSKIQAWFLHAIQ